MGDRPVAPTVRTRFSRLDGRAHITQTALLPVAYCTGTDFKPARHLPTADFVSWDGWTAGGTRSCGERLFHEPLPFGSLGSVSKRCSVVAVAFSERVRNPFVPSESSVVSNSG